MTTVEEANDQDTQEVPTEQGQEFARLNNLGYIETSAKDGTGVQELMDDIMGQAFNLHLKNRDAIAVAK